MKSKIKSISGPFCRLYGKYQFFWKICFCHFFCFFYCHAEFQKKTNEQIPRKVANRHTDRWACSEAWIIGAPLLGAKKTQKDLFSKRIQKYKNECFSAENKVQENYLLLASHFINVENIWFFLVFEKYIKRNMVFISFTGIWQKNEPLDTYHTNIIAITSMHIVALNQLDSPQNIFTIKTDLCQSCIPSWYLPAQS